MLEAQRVQGVTVVLAAQRERIDSRCCPSVIARWQLSGAAMTGLATARTGLVPACGRSWLLGNTGCGCLMIRALLLVWLRSMVDDVVIVLATMNTS